MKAYISISYSKRKVLEDEVCSIIETLKEMSIEPFVFVDQYKFDATEEKEMMRQALVDIDNCDVLVAEVSDKAIGIGIEAGYAKAKGKPIIYMRNNSSEHSTTLSGISDFQIIYRNVEELRFFLIATIEILVQQNYCT